jgi:hypothetical protein
MPANRFVLKGHNIEVDYTIGITPGLPALTYKNGPDVRTFHTGEITTNATALGSIVSVSLVRTVDTGGEVFGFFLPQLTVPAGQTENFMTAGVFERFSGPDSIPARPPSWISIELRGSAQTVMVPLVQSATT